MSIKIYNAFKIPNMTTEELFHRISLLKEEVKNQQLKFLKNEINKKCLKLFDHATIYPDTLVVFDKISYEPSYQKEVMSIVLEELELKQKIAKKNDKIDDFFFRANFYYYDNNIYVTTHQMPQRNYDSAIPKVFKDAESFEYFNNTDHPKNLTQKQWNQRNKEWQQVLGSNYRSSNCLEVNCWLQFPYDTYELKPIKLSKTLLENPNRVKEMAVSVVQRRYKHLPDQKMLAVQLLTGSKEYDQELNEVMKDLDSKIKKTPDISEVLESKFTVKKTGRKSEADYYIVVFDF